VKLDTLPPRQHGRSPSPEMYNVRLAIQARADSTARIPSPSAGRARMHARITTKWLSPCDARAHAQVTRRDDLGWG
jgi:hypothetical protein